MTKTLDAIYERGVLRPRGKLPFHEHTLLKLTIVVPPNPIRRTRGIIRVSPSTTRAIIYGDEAEFFSS